MKTPAIIVDLDNTLFNVQERIDSFELKDANNAPEDFNWDDFFQDLHLDKINSWAETIVRKFMTTHDILYVTRRWDKIREETEKQLHKFNLLSQPSEHLFMAHREDMRRSPEVKRDIYLNEIENRWEVLFVLDDDKKVCHMFYDLGLPSLNVVTKEDLEEQ